MCNCTNISKTHDNVRKLVTTDWLEKNLNDTSLILFYIGSEAGFDSIHIPNSNYISVWDMLINTDELRNEFQSIHVLDSILEMHGVNNHSQIVLYHENEKMLIWVARIFVTLDYLGLGSNTAIVNGGLKKWLKEQKAVTTEVVNKPKSKLDVKINPATNVNHDFVKTIINNPNYFVMDAHPADIFAGLFDTIENKYSGGHINGAVNLPFSNLLVDSLPYLFKNDTELLKEFENIGVNSNQTIIHQCGSGILASVNYLISKHLGYKSMFYDGGTEEWEKLNLPLIRTADSINRKQD